MSEERKIELYNTQHDFVACEDRFPAFIGGVGSGKTTAGVVKALLTLARRGGLGMVVAPTYPMLRDSTLRAFKKIASGALSDFHITGMRARMRNGAEVLFRSADNPDRLRGPNLTWAYIDEAALCPPQTWEIVVGRLREGEGAPCWITTTPRGRNWVYDRQDVMTTFHARTQDNPYLDPGFIRSLEDAYKGQFARQELGGEFVAFEGLIYDEFDRTVHLVERSGPWAQVVAGVDEGYTNPTAVLVVGLDGDGRAHVIDEFYRRRVLQGDLIAETSRLAERYGISTFYVDPSAAGLIAEMCAAGLPAQAAENAVMPGIQAVKARLTVAGDGRPRLTVSSQCPNTAAEFESYCWKEGRQGLRDQPESINNHAMDALRYVILSVERPSGLVIEIIRHFGPQSGPRPPWETD